MSVISKRRQGGGGGGGGLQPLGLSSHKTIFTKYYYLFMFCFLIQATTFTYRFMGIILAFLCPHKNSFIVILNV